MPGDNPSRSDSYKVFRRVFVLEIESVKNVQDDILSPTIFAKMTFVLSTKLMLIAAKFECSVTICSDY